MFIKLIVPLMLILLQGCALTTSDYGKKITSKVSADLPNYSINDVFIYTDGYIERVSDINGDVIDWEVSGGRFSYKAYRNFTLPLISWETKTKKGDNEMKVLDKKVLWPLIPDEDYKISLKKNISKKDMAFSNRFFFQDWRCETEDPRRVTVPAGTFNTVPITCKLSSFSGNTIKTRTWFYSPAIGHYVKKVDERPQSRNRPRKIKEYDLTGYIPALSNLTSAELRDAEDHLQLSLEKLPSGSETEWFSLDKKVIRNMSIIGTFKTQDERVCRDVAFRTKSPTSSKTYTTTFCRDTNAWKIALSSFK